MSPRKEIETTVQELAYRDKQYHHIGIVKERRIACCSCGNELSLLSKQIFSHPWMGILQCEQCRNHFKEVNRRFGKDQTEEYCYICGSNSKLYVCGDKDCISAFCKKCIKRNVSLSLLDAKKDNWKCFACNPKPFWELRAVCAAVMSDLSKKDKRRDTHKLEKSLPSEKQRVKKTKEVQKALKALCDEDDENNYSDNSFVTARFMQRTYNTDHYIKQDSNLNLRKTLLKVIDSSSECSPTSDEQDKQRRNRKYQKTKSVDKQNSSKDSTQKDSKLATNGKCKSRKNRISDDSDDNISLSKTAKQKHIIKHKKSEETQNKTSNRYYTNFSDSESENDSINEISNASKSLPKHITHQKKTKISSSCDMKSTKDKPKKHHNSSSESEDDIEYKKQTKKKSSTDTLRNNNKDEQKHENRGKSLKRRLCEIQDDSDGSSGKEFQKIKIQKVHGDKYSKKQLVDLEIDHTKSIDLENEKNEKSINEEMNVNKVKEIVKECKKTCSNFLIHIDSVEQLCGKKDEEQLLLKFTKQINKLKMTLEKNEKNLTTFCQSWSKSSKPRKNIATKKSHRIVSDNEQFSERPDIHEEEEAVNENKSNSGNERESKNVSECDSEEIFSADETRTPQKTRTTRDENDKSRIEDDLDDDNTNVSKDKTLMDKSKNNDSSNMSLQEESATSPVLGISKEKKIRTENIEPIKKQLFSEYVDSNSKEIQLLDEDTDSKDKQAKLNTDTYDEETASGDFFARDGNKKTTLQNDNQNNSNKIDIINESLDMFDTSFDILGEEEFRVEAQKVTETSFEKTKPSPKSLDTSEISLQDEISNEQNNAVRNDGNEKDLNQNDQENIVSTPASKKIHDGSKETVDTFKKTNLDDVESVDEVEMLAKKALLESDSDTSENTVVNTNIAKQTEDLIIDTNLRKDKAEDNNSDVSSNTSTLILSFTKSMNDAEIKETTEVTDASEESQLDKKSGKESEISQTSDETNAKREEAAKKALLESNSEDSKESNSEDSKESNSEDSSIILSSLESEETDEKSKLNTSRENAEAKKALLASSNSESFSSELISETEVNISNKIEDRVIDSDEDLLSRIKKKKLKLSKNYHYKKDKKLMFCKVYLERLNNKVLKQYSHALKMSREYLEQKALKRYQIYSLKPIYVVLHRLK